MVMCQICQGTQMLYFNERPLNEGIIHERPFSEFRGTSIGGQNSYIINISHKKSPKQLKSLASA